MDPVCTVQSERYICCIFYQFPGEQAVVKVCVDSYFSQPICEAAVTCMVVSMKVL